MAQSYTTFYYGTTIIINDYLYTSMPQAVIKAIILTNDDM